MLDLLEMWKNWQTSKSDMVTCPADNYKFLLISIPEYYEIGLIKKDNEP